MKQTIGNLLLVLGVIVAALAAGESQRVSRAAAIDEDLIGRVLHTRVSTNFETTHPEVLIYEDRALEAGKTLDAQDLAWLRTLELDEVLVLQQPVVEVSIPVAPKAIGRSLSAPVLLQEEEEEIDPGRLISAGLAERLQDSELQEIKVGVKRPQPDGPDLIEEMTWSLAGDAEAPEGLQLVGSTLREKVTLPVQLKIASYVDEGLLERLMASKVQTITVKIPREWRLEQWGDRWTFLFGLLLTTMGVVLKRAKPSAESQEEEQLELAHLAEQLISVEGQVERLVQRSKEMDAAALHAAVDPLLGGPIYTIAEGREAIRAAHGGRVFGAVMDAFARGERKLNRAWSAAVDGHAEESRASLAASLPSLREAREALPGTSPPPAVGYETDGEQAPLPPDVPLGTGEGHWADDES